MTSIIDDFTAIYNEIINDIIEKKKIVCNDDSNDDNSYNCENIYEITTNGEGTAGNMDDIDIRLDEENYSRDNINSYKDSIRNQAKIFSKNNMYYDDDDETTDINKRVYHTHIDDQITSFESIRNNYEFLDKILLWLQWFLMAFLIKRYILDYMFMFKSSDKTMPVNNNGNSSKNVIKSRDFGKFATKRAQRLRQFMTGQGFNVCTLDDYILTGAPVISITWLAFDVIRNTLKNRENELNTNITKLKTIKNNDISILINSITGPTGLSNIENENTNFKDNLKVIVKEYNKIQDKNLTNNRYSKNQKIKSMNEFFDELKHIVLISDNKFRDIVIDNQDQVICLMKLITHEGNKKGTDCLNDNSNVCNLNINCGFRGVVQNQYLQFRNGLEDDSINTNDFRNGLGEIIDANDSKITDFFDNIQNKVIDSSIQFSIKNSPVFKIINNIFILKIKYYGIKKIQFFKYIYKYFGNYESDNNINKQDMINNYKTLINMIYENYTIYSNINENKEYLASNLISKHRFSEIMNKYNTDELLRIILKLEKTISEIEDFKNIYKEDITSDIKVDKNQNKNFFNFLIVLFISSISKSIGIVMKLLGDVDDCEGEEINKKNEESSLTNKMLRILIIMTLVVLLNSIVYSYWFKKSVEINFKESIILDSNNKFLRKLHDTHQYLKYLYDMKKLDIKNVDNLINVFDKFNIKYFKYDDSDLNIKVLLYSKYNSGDNYTILDKNDIMNIITEQLYLKISDVIKIYECCSFLKEDQKKVVLPYQEISLNIIFIIMTIVVFIYIFSDPSLNPFYLFDEVLNGKKKLSLYQQISDKSLQSQFKKYGQNGKGQSGGANDGFKNYGQLKGFRSSTQNLIYITTIYLSIKFINLLYNSNIEYEKSLYQ